MERNDRISVFADTVACVSKGYYTNKKGEKVEIPTESEGLSMENVSFYSSDIKKNINFDKLKRHKTEIKVVNQDCLYAAKELIDDGYSPVVVNFASFKRPGGGVANGSAAQEENLCRRTNLYESIFRFKSDMAKEYGLPCEKAQYPLPVNHGAIYSPSIAVFKASEDKNYEYLDEPFMVDIITIAALSHPNLTKDGNLAKWDRDITKQKIRTMLNLGLYWENDSIVLGAFGCGAFANPPEDIAKAFKEVIDEPEYCDKYEKIVFAILDDHNSHREHNPRGNYLPFVETFSE